MKLFNLIGIEQDEHSPTDVPIISYDAQMVAGPFAEGTPSVEITRTTKTIEPVAYASGIAYFSNTFLAKCRPDALFPFIESRLQSVVGAQQGKEWMRKLAAEGNVGVTTASPTGPTYAELLTWQDSIPVHRQDDGCFFVSTSLRRKLRGLSDDHGNPVFIESPRTGEPARLLGWPCWIAAGLATVGAGAVSGIAASAESFVVTDFGPRTIMRYMHQSNHRDSVGVQIFAYSDMVFDQNGVRTLKHAAA